ncbi:MAG: hypothetical protein JRK53_28140, partial [Deltaproteobacteria bacterium]|nr:hypothetical protein [Deltaproteobacteria bacterium]
CGKIDGNPLNMTLNSGFTSAVKKLIEYFYENYQIPGMAAPGVPDDALVRYSIDPRLVTIKMKE